MEVLEDPDEGNKPRGPVIEALEDPDWGNEVHDSNSYHCLLYTSDAADE